MINTQQPNNKRELDRKTGLELTIRLGALMGKGLEIRFQLIWL